MEYERGLDALKQLAEGTDWHRDFTLHEAPLRENLRDERRYGPSEQTRRDRTRIVDQLNTLALKHLDISFNDLCLGKQPPPRPASSAPPPGTKAGGAWETGAIRQLLTEAFSDQELTALCYDHFRPVYETFSDGMDRGQKVQQLLAYCERQEQIEPLLEQVRARNRAKYDRFAARLHQALNREVEP